MQCVSHLEAAEFVWGRIYSYLPQSCTSIKVSWHWNILQCSLGQNLIIMIMLAYLYCTLYKCILKYAAVGLIENEYYVCDHTFLRHLGETLLSSYLYLNIGTLQKNKGLMFFSACISGSNRRQASMKYPSYTWYCYKVKFNVYFYFCPAAQFCKISLSNNFLEAGWNSWYKTWVTMSEWHWWNKHVHWQSN